jgi:hypothetical protein
MEGKVDQEKPKRGAPRSNLKALYDELQRRLECGEASETVTKEAKYLEGWAKKNQLFENGKYLKWERIRDRIRIRHKGAQGYKNARDWHLHQLIAKARRTE